MPPKRRATRAAAKAASEEPETGYDASVARDEPAAKKTKARGRPKKKGNGTEETSFQAPKDQANILKTKNDTPNPKTTTAAKPEPKKDTSLMKDISLKKDTPKEQKNPALKKQLSITTLLPPSSPTKPPTKPILSRIPSPMRKQSLAHKPSMESLDSKKIETLIHQTFNAKNIPKLSSILEDLKTTKANQNFAELKAMTDSRVKASDDLISTLSSRNEQLSQQLENAMARITQLEQQGSVSPPVNNGISEQADYENQLILDMMEQIVGLRIHKSEETDEVLSFSCSQSGTNGILDYKLIISKEDSSEIIYEPMNNKEEAQQLKEFLPEYFLDDLSFPLDSLQQFYHKIYRGLNK